MSSKEVGSITRAITRSRKTSSSTASNPRSAYTVDKASNSNRHGPPTSNSDGSTSAPIPASVMPAAEVIASYHDLWHVEASFRMAKSDLRARPIFHHTREAIEAHLTIVFAALAVSRYLQDTTGLSLKKIVRTLKPLQQITVRIAGHDHLAADPLTEPAQQILNAISPSAPTH